MTEHNLELVSYLFNKTKDYNLIFIKTLLSLRGHQVWLTSWKSHDAMKFC